MCIYIHYKIKAVPDKQIKKADKIDNILQINTEFNGVFPTKPMIAFKYNKNLLEIVGDHVVEEGEVFKKNQHR